MKPAVGKDLSALKDKVQFVASRYTFVRVRLCSYKGTVFSHVGEKGVANIIKTRNRDICIHGNIELILH
jgi:hypothetical protein